MGKIILDEEHVTKGSKDVVGIVETYYTALGPSTMQCPLLRLERVC